ncbi:hypothetical protein AX766_12895 [Flavobacterium covae]|uniref:hypothetical protein n=1 Tax=Flavobacterium TaxID=237 RepID=UPI0007C17600|nr:hypothetical protein [Flavobacterium covae]AND65219.1 hypothetical protein AX766_12895 [Flavobacterium covae]
MTENIIFTLQLIQIDFFTAFGLYTFLYLFVSIFTKNPVLKKVDNKATAFISFAGIVYLLVWITGLIVELTILTPEDKTALLNRMFGKYWVAFWTQPLLWVFLTQLLRFPIVQKNVFTRLVSSIFLILSIERMVISITIFHRDYLPSSWTMYSDLDIYPSNYFLALLLKIIVFLVFVGIFSVITTKLKEIKKNSKTTA